jgi:diadenosine tetraphosphatase ApaH/serine/threonine PP2A family protein phosphatase
MRSGIGLPFRVRIVCELTPGLRKIKARATLGMIDLGPGTRAGAGKGPMRTAVVTDIHANRAAFEAVLADLALRGIDRIAILGDIVGYGPDPEWCTDRVMELAAGGNPVIQGNHDAAIGAPQGDLNPVAQSVIDWTRSRLSEAQRSFLATLPLIAEADGVCFAHASPSDPGGWVYLTSNARAAGAFRATDARLILVGHLHRPALMSCDRRSFVTDHPFRIGQPVPLLASRRWLAVIGAVGQPRDGSPLAAYAIHDAAAATLTLRRCAYDVAATVARLRAEGLPEPLAARLQSGD